MGVRCAAVLAVRNEATHLAVVLDDLIAQGIDVAVIDNGSTDGSLDIARAALGKGVVLLEQTPYAGFMDLTEQLQRKAAVIDALDHEWIVHVDADEWLQSPRQGESLLDGIQRASAAGYNALNFDEFVFLPEPDRIEDPGTHRSAFLRYYYFAPEPSRLMRAWDRSSGLSNVTTGGHRLVGGELRLSPEAFVLRHYIVLSQRHAVEKYAGRTFASWDLANGWHGNRLNLDPDRLRLPDVDRLKALPSWDSVDFDRSDPRTTHYWDWS